MAAQSARCTNFLFKGERGFYFIPPYVGPSGSLGVNLDQGLDWQIISQRIYEAYSYVAPERVGVLQVKTLEIEPPIEGIDAEEFDPFQRPEIAVVQAMISDLYLVLPDVAPGQQFSTPCFRAGKKNFCILHFYRSRP